MAPDNSDIDGKGAVPDQGRSFRPWPHQLWVLICMSALPGWKLIALLVVVLVSIFIPRVLNFDPDWPDCSDL